MTGAFQLVPISAQMKTSISTQMKAILLYEMFDAGSHASKGGSFEVFAPHFSSTE